MPDQRDVVQDVTDFNQEVCCRLWRMVSVREIPMEGAPRLIYPEYSQHKTPNDANGVEAAIHRRESEQEARFAYAEALSCKDIYFYSVETPTDRRYGKGSRSAMSDKSLYLPDNTGKLQKKVNIEFKYGTNGLDHIQKDLEKIVQEHITEGQLVGNRFHILDSGNSNAFKALFGRFNEAFAAVSKKVHDGSEHGCDVSVVVCICALRDKWACFKHFKCPNNSLEFSKYVVPFFELNLKVPVQEDLRQHCWELYPDAPE